MTRKLVIEITDTEGRTQLLKRRSGIVNFIDNIDSFFKSGGKGRRAIKGVAMFFVDDSEPLAIVVPGTDGMQGSGKLMTADELQAEAEIKGDDNGN